MIDYQDTGFVFFPTEKYNTGNIEILDIGKTFVYLVAIDCENTEDFSTVSVSNKGVYCGNDILSTHLQTETVTIDDAIKIMTADTDKKSSKSPALVSSILLGWSKSSYYFDATQPWICGFNNLTEHGRRLYFSLKKLHNDKEIKILTFNHIK